MFGRDRGAKTTIAETAGTVTEAVADAADAVVGMSIRSRKTRSCGNGLSRRSWPEQRRGGGSVGRRG